MKPTDDPIFRVVVGLVVVMTVVIAFAVVGQADYEEARAQEQEYREMVCAGYWPAYNGEVDCD